MPDDSGPRVTRRKLVLIDNEAVRGTPVAPATPILAFDPQINYTGPFIERKPASGSAGHFPGVRAEQIGTLSFQAELRGNGSAVAPDFDAGIKALLLCCGFKRDASAGVTYYPATSPADQKASTLYVYEWGSLKALAGAAGTVVFECTAGRPIVLRVNLSGIWLPVTDAALPEPTHNATLPPRFAGVGLTLDAWAAVVSRMTLDPRFNLVAREDASHSFPAGAETVRPGVRHYCVTDRDPRVEIDPEDTSVADNDLWGAVLDGSAFALSATVGDTVGNKFSISAPAVQYAEATEGDRGGKAVNNLSCVCIDAAADDSDFSLSVAQPA